MIKYSKNGIEKILNDNEAKELIMSEMLETWQPAASIGLRVGLTTKSVVILCKQLTESGRLISNKLYADGHNKIYFYKIPQILNVLGVRMVINNNSDEAVDI